MSRTTRRIRPTRAGSWLRQRYGKNARVPDKEAPANYPTAACQPHGGCPYCESNRLHSRARQKSPEDDEGLQDAPRSKERAR